MCTSGPCIPASAVHQSVQCINCTTWADSDICVVYNAEINEYPDGDTSGKSVGKSEDEAFNATNSAAGDTSAGCQSNICRTLGRHCCLTCSLQRSWPGGCRVCLVPLQFVLLTAVPVQALVFCCQAQSLQLCVPEHCQCLEPYLQMQSTHSRTMQLFCAYKLHVIAHSYARPN